MGIEELFVRESLDLLCNLSLACHCIEVRAKKSVIASVALISLITSVNLDVRLVIYFLPAFHDSF
jgi:hypothetical protein